MHDSLIDKQPGVPPHQALWTVQISLQKRNLADGNRKRSEGQTTNAYVVVCTFA